MSEASTWSRLESIPTLPIFLKLRGRPVLVAGGEPSAAWKTELLVAAGAQVRVVAQEPAAELEAVAIAMEASGVSLIRRPWFEADLSDMAVAIGAFTDEHEAARFAASARAAGVPVNVIDKPDYCDFQFGTLIARSPVVIAITTDGAAPVIGQALRARIEALLPDGLRAWAEAAQAWRPLVRARDWPFAKRRRFWEMVAERALRPDGPQPSAAERQACFDAVERAPDSPFTRMTLVGCGSGSADDLTFAGARALQNADLIIHDTDVAIDAVQLGRREALKMSATSDEEALRAARDQPARDRRIVWLGTGNPCRCAHWKQRYTLLQHRFGDIASLPGLDRCPRCSERCAPIEPGVGPADAA